MNIIVGLAALGVLLVLTLDAFGVLPPELQPEVVEPEPTETQIESSSEMQADQLLFQEKQIEDQAKKIEDQWINSGTASYSIDV